MIEYTEQELRQDFDVAIRNYAKKLQEVGIETVVTENKAEQPESFLRTIWVKRKDMDINFSNYDPKYEFHIMLYIAPTSDNFEIAAKFSDRSNETACWLQEPELALLSELRALARAYYAGRR